MLSPPSILLYGFSIEYILSLEYLRNSEYNRRKTPRRYLGMKMKKLVKAVALAVCLTMTAPVVAPSVGIETVEAATKVKLNCTKKSIYEGNRFKLKVTGTSKKVKWSSSNKNVATVSSKGIVTGIDGGTTEKHIKYTLRFVERNIHVK